MTHKKIRGEEVRHIQDRFTGRGAKVILPPRKLPKLLIKGTITAIGEGEFQDDAVYQFRISPLGQDKDGRDRVFTFASYTRQSLRQSEKHSEARKTIARRLRAHHTLLWQRFHEAYD